MEVKLGGTHLQQVTAPRRGGLHCDLKKNDPSLEDPTAFPEF
jgi:hypothetical protein